MSDKLKFCILCLPVLLLVSTALAQDTLWTKTYGGSNDEDGCCVRQTQDGGYIVAGYTSSYGAGGGDVYLIKTNSQGDTLWTRTYGGSGGDGAHSVQQTEDEGYIVAGNTSSYGAGLIDVYLIKTNPQGDTLWTRTYGGSEEEYCFSVQQTQDGGYIVAGYTSSYGAGGTGVYLIKTNSQGDTLWTRTYGGSSDDAGRSVQQTQDGGYIVAGATKSYGAGYYSIYLIKTNPQGDTTWTKTYGGSELDIALSVQQTQDGGYIVAGYTRSNGAESDDMYLIKTNSQGDTLWTRTYGGSSGDVTYSVQQTQGGEYIMAGYTYSYGAGGGDVYLIKTNSQGDTLWTRTYGGSDNEYGHSVQQTEDGGYIVSGITWSYGAGSSDVYLIKVKEGGISTIILLDPDPNPLVSDVMSGGAVYRYYLTVDSNNVPQPYVFVGVEFDSESRTFMSDENGVVKCSLLADDLGTPGQTIPVTISSLNGVPLSPSDQITFDVSIQERRYERELGFDASVNASLSLELGGGVSQERAIAMKLEGTKDNPDKNIAERLSELSASLGVGGAIGVGLTVDSFNAGGYAGAGVYAGVGVFKKEEYAFDYPGLTFDQSVAELLVILDPSTHTEMDPLYVQLFTFLLVNYTEIGQVLQDAYVRGDKGIEFFAGAEENVTANSATLPMSNPLLNLSLDASGSVEGRFKWHIYENSLASFQPPEGTGFELLGRVSTSVDPNFSDFSFGLHPWSSIGDLPHALEIWDEHFLFDGQLGGRIDFLYDGEGNFRIEITLLRDIQTGSVETITEDRFWIDIDQQWVMNEIMGVLTCTDNLYQSIVSGLSGPFDIATTRNTLAAIVFDIFYKIYQLQESLPSLKIYYQQDTGEFDKHEMIKLQFNVGVLVASGGIGAEGTTHLGKNMCTRKGVWLDGTLRLLETYTDDYYTSVEADVLQVPQQLIGNLGQPVLDLAYSVFSQVVEAGATVIEMGNSFLTLVEGAVEVGETVGAVFWNWWGSSPKDKPSILAPEEFAVRSQIKQQLQDFHNLAYGIGGFYDLSPKGLVLNASGELTIAYSDSEIIGMDETQLAMYYWNDSTSTWAYFGGVVDTSANTVTAVIDTFRLYTLAPVMPAYKINLIPDPDTLLADSVSLCHIVSDTIRNNNGTVVEDGEMFTVNSDAGSILTPDADSVLDGIQIESDYGIISFDLKAPAIAWNAHITARSVNGWAFGEVFVTFIDTTALSPPSIIAVFCKDTTLTLKWQLGNELDLAGYKIYYDLDTSGPPYDGISAYDLPSPIDVGKTDTRTIYGLLFDTTYYFALTSYDISGNESQYSQETAIPFPFAHGDVNSDDKLDLGDVIYLANYLLKGGTPPTPLYSGDVNCDTNINLSDVIYLANYLLKGGPPPCP